jgi:hypothetical protein
MNEFQITSQRELRKRFWESYPEISRKLRRDPNESRHNRYCTDTRVAFVDYIDAMRRDGFISEALAQRATL